MPRTRYERDAERYAGPKFRRVVLLVYLLAAVIGLIAGGLWLVWLAWRGLPLS